MKRVLIIGLLITLLSPLATLAQTPSIKVNSKQQVSVGEQFKVAFEVNADGSNFKAPSFEGFTRVGGPFTATSSSVQMVNGSVTRTVSNTYSYMLRAEKEGEFTIGEASVTVDGNVLKSEPFTVTVLADASGVGNTTQGSTAQGGNSGGQRQQNTTDPQINGQDLFLKVIPSKRSAYVGEPVVLTYKLYTRVPVSQLSISKMPAYGGFWMKECGDNSNTLHQSSETVNGIEYTTAEVKKVVLIPQKTGKLTIEPMGLECLAQVVTQRNSQLGNDPFFDAFFNDPFFSRSYSTVQKNVETSAITMEVKSLPEDGKPDVFAGAVGDYKFSVNIDKDETSTNEALTLTVTVSGSGNLELVNMPTPVFPPDFEVYDPKVTSNVEASGQGMKGTRKAEYLIIPRHAGDFSIAPMTFSYFNPAKQQYVTLNSQQLNVQVSKGSGDVDDGGVYIPNQENVKVLGSDIRHIKTGAARLKPTDQHFFASILYFALILGLLVVFLVALFLVNKRRQFKQDTVLVRNKRATKVAKGRLKNAHKFLKEQDQNHFYEEMSQALWGYISDKLGIERSVLSMDTAKEAMMQKGVDETLANEFVETLDACEFARFAPGDAASKMEGLYNKGLDVIMKVEKTI